MGNDKRNYLRGFGYQGGAGRQGWSREVAELSIGAAFKEALTEPGSWTIGATGFGEILPYHENKISLDPTKKDKWNLPVLSMDCELKQNELDMRKDIVAELKAMLEAGGAKNISSYDNGHAIGHGIHEMGTARMGRDAKTSVLNGNNQVWDAKNVFLLQEQIFDAAIAINASPYSTKKHQSRNKTAQNFTKTLNKPLIYVNQVGGQNFLVFDGSSFVMNAQGENVLQLNGFCEDDEIIEINKEGEIKSPIAEILPSEEERDYSACVLGLRDYIKKNNFKNVLLGMSGGIDSALVATMAVDALGSENVTLYALPSRFNSENSMIDAKSCGRNLDLELKIISIESALETMLETLGEISDLAKENLQSRIRGNILMALSNNSGALLLSTGNKSELACGYATLYGDMCGAFNPIKDLYKTRVYELANWRNQNVPNISIFPHKNLIPQNIITKAPTAELRPNQKDSDSLPEYEILDRILFYLIEEKRSVLEIIAFGFEQELVEKIANLFYRSEYKRQQSCLGPKISEMSFDRDRRYPVTNKFII
jgi:NAD+ synthase